MFEQVALPSLKQAIGVDQDLLRRQQINGSNQAVRGWNSADISEDAAGLMWKANQAKISGDTNSAAVFEQQGRDLMQQASQWAPTVRDVTDVNSVESFGDWVGGALGNVRSSIKPALGGLAGAAIGAVAAPFTGGVINPLLGARVGAGLAGYNTMTESNVADMMMNERIRANRTAAEIANAARGAGAVQGALESVVPAGVAGSVVGLGGRKAAAEIAKNGLLRTAGKHIGIDAAEEFATEFAQNPVGDIAKNYLKGDALGNVDWQAALNAGAAGAVGGGGMGAVGAGFDAAHAGLGKGVDKAREIKNDPLGTILDAGVDLAAKAGTAKAKLENYFDERELKAKGLTQDEIDQGRLEQIQKTLAGKSDLTSTSPFTEEENAMDAPTFNAHHEGKLKADAATILKAGRDSTGAEKDIASKYANGEIDAVEFQTRLHQVQNDKVAEKETDALLTGLGQNKKSSLIKPGSWSGENEKQADVDAGRGVLPKDDLTPSDRMYLESELLKPDTKQKVNTLADIMVKQGIDEKIIHATNGEHNKLQLAGMLNWISDGMNDTPEAVKAIVTRFGQGSSAIFKKAYGLAKNNGLIKPHDEFADEVVSRLDFAANTERVLTKALKDNLSDIALHGVQDVDGAVKKLVPMMKTVVQEGMSAKVKQGLIENFFGTEERLHNVMNAYIDTGEHKKKVSKATGGGKEEVEIDADGNIVAPEQYDEDGELIVDKFGAGASVSEVKGPTIVGFTNPKGRVGVPFNLGFDKGIEKFEKVKAQHDSEMGNSVAVAGIWSRTKADLGNDAEAIEQAGYDLLESFGPKLMPEGKYASLINGFSEGTIDIGDLSPRQRAVLLGRINRQFKYLEVTKPDSGDLKHNVQDVDAFKWNPKDAKPATFTAQKGIIFLERKMPGKEASDFPVSTTYLFNQGTFTETGKKTKRKDGTEFPVGNFANTDGTNGSTLEGKRRGALGTSDLVMSGLTDLMLAEGGNFTGRIGYRLKEGGELQWIENAERDGNVKLERLPDELTLGMYFDVGDAKAQAAVELKQEKSDENTGAEYESYKLPFVTSVADKRKALLDLGVKLDTDIKEKIKEVIERFTRKYPTWVGEDAQAQLQLNINRAVYRLGEKAGIYLRDPRQVIRHALQSGAPATNKLYTEMRNKFEGAVDGFGGTPMSNDAEARVSMRRNGQKESMPAPSSAQGRIEAEDGNVAEVHRDDTGMRVGYGPDGWGAGYEGPASQRSRQGTKAESALAVGGMRHVDENVGITPRDASAIKELSTFVNGGMRLMRTSEFAQMDRLFNWAGDGVKRSLRLVASFAVGKSDSMRAMGQTFVTKSGESVIVLNEAVFGAASWAKAFTTLHELGHVVGDVSDLQSFESNGEIGTLAKKLSTGDVFDRLQYPLDRSTLVEQYGEAKADSMFPKELHAQLFAMYNHPKWNLIFKEEANDLYKSVERTLSGKEFGGSGMVGRGGKPGNVGSVEGRRDENNRQGARVGNAVGESDSLRSGETLNEKGSNGKAQRVRPEKSPAVGERSGSSEASVGRSNQAVSETKGTGEKEQLQAYLDQHGSKNAPWAGAARKAIASNNETQIRNTLAAGKKQFGAVNVENVVKIELKAPKVEAQVLPMSYKIHNLADIRPELRSKYRQGAGIAELIGNGDRTATTRAVPTGVKVGSIIRFPGVEGTYKVTSIEKIDLNSKEGVEAWSKKEGWDTSMVKGFGNQVRHGATQITFERVEAKQSTQQPNKPKGKLKERVAEAEAHLLKTLGPNIDLLYMRMSGMSGEWTPGTLKNTIALALNGDVLGAAFHESFHEFMDILKKNAATKTADVLQRAAMNPMIQRKLERLLDGHPEAIAQLKDPEEAAAFMYQFWSAGLLKIGPETRTAFDTVKNFLKKVAGFFSEGFRKEVEAMTREQLEAGHAEHLLRQFSEGAVANMDTRQMVVEAMEKNTEVHNAAVERVGSAFNTFANTAGKLVFSSEAMMDATGNKHMVEIMRGMHQKVGTAMRQFGRSTGAYSDGLHQATSQWMHKVEATLAGYSKEDLELARAAMSQEKEPTDRVAKEIVAKINGLYAEMAQYMRTKGVKRLNIDRIDANTGMKGVWEDIPLRKNYLSQVWSIDKLMESMGEFKVDLLKHHLTELEVLAVAANKELKDMKGVKAGTAAGIELERADKEFKDSGKVMAKMNLQTITPEMIADAIGTRLLASHGHIEISESNSGMGITPAASAVNKRELNWLDKEVFDKYKEKDLTNILTTYVHSIVKRGEYQSRFGPAGELIADSADKAVLFELGGDALVDKAVAKLPAAKKAWAKGKATGGEDFTEPFPTLRSVGQEMHRAEVGQEKHDAALLKTMKKLKNGFDAIQALEGTLGRDISPSTRALNSWLVTYQSFRTLSTMLFTSFQDVAGIVVNGGEAGDAWNAFVEGIREIRNTVFDNKDPSARMKAAEFWGTVDAGAFLESTAQAHGSPFMSGKAKAWSDTFFKYTGAVGWNRGVRSVATQVAERIITGWKTEGVDRNDKAAVSRLEDLFGKGFDPANIKLTAEGRLDPSDAANQAAVTRWVLTAVPAPTAAHRTIWMSDPHYAVFAQLKNYTYSFHRIMMKNAADQARLGNYRPVLAMLLGYTPIAIAAGAIKETLIPGEEPPWMKGGLDGYLSYGFARAGVLGVPQMMLGSVLDASQLPGGNFAKAGSSFDPAALAGPTVDQVQNILSIPFGEFLAMKDHTVIGEGLGALPGGNLVKRLERLGGT